MSNIVSVGLDIVSIERIRRDLEEHPGLIDRFASKEEMARYSDTMDPIVHYSGVLAIKEAAIKTLGPSVSDGPLYKDITVEGPPPRIVLSGKAADLARKLGISEFKVSLSHEGGMAIAVAIATGD